MPWHILPINDTYEHEELSNCHCQPDCEILENGELMVIHTAFDGRK